MQLLAAGHHRPAAPPYGQWVADPQNPGSFVRSTFNWRFPDLIFLLTIQNFGTFGAS